MSKQTDEYKAQQAITDCSRWHSKAQRVEGPWWIPLAIAAAITGLWGLMELAHAYGW